MAEGQCSETCNSLCQFHVIRDLVTLTLYRLCTWWSPKKKSQHPVSRTNCVPQDHNRDLTVFFKSFSARVVKAMLEIKDNSNFIKDKDRGVQIKDCPLKIKDGWQPYIL